MLPSLLHLFDLRQNTSALDLETLSDAFFVNGGQSMKRCFMRFLHVPNSSRNVFATAAARGFKFDLQELSNREPLI